MRFGLDREQEFVRDEARKFFADLAPGVGERGPDRAWRALTELGWQAVGVEEKAGGGGGGLLDLAVVLTEAGRSLLPLPLVSTAGLAGAFLHATGERGRPHRQRIAAGDACTLALHGGSDELRQAGDEARLAHGLLQGERQVVTDAGAATWLVVPVTSAGEHHLAVVRATEAVISAGPGIDPSRPLHTVTFDDSEPVDVIPLDLSSAYDRAATALAAELVGLADGALHQAVGQALTREQFGKPIGSFQAIKHRLADCYVATERARSLLFAAAAACDDQDAPAAVRARTVSMAKAAAGDAALFTTAANVQLHAAIAMTGEHTALGFLRRARQGAALLGNSNAHLRAAGRSFIAEVIHGAA